MGNEESLFSNLVLLLDPGRLPHCLAHHLTLLGAHLDLEELALSAKRGRVRECGERGERSLHSLHSLTLSQTLF